jgi:hypothetical protein
MDLNTIDLKLTRTYNSSDSDEAGIIGNGWKTNYEAGLVILPRYGKTKANTNLRVLPGKSNSVVFMMAAGNTLEYVRNSDGSISTTSADGITWEKCSCQIWYFMLNREC